MMKMDVISKFVGDQLSRWTLACNNFRALKNVKIKTMDIGGLQVKLQFNPARMISSAAKLSKEDIAARKCFLCRENRPGEQIMIKFEGRKGKKYHILVNPYPIFPDHLVIAMATHTEQSIWKRYVDMLDLAKKYQKYTFFYNGPRSGASAPDHHHFQGAPQELIPLEMDVDRCLKMKDPVLEQVASLQDAELYHYRRFTTGVFVLRSDTAKSAAKLFYRLLDCADIPEGEKEPLINLFSYYKEGEFRSIVVFRSRHRSHHYFSDGPDHLTMSPGCADMGGVFIVPVQKEFETITQELLSEMVAEVSITKQEQDLIIHRLTRTQKSLEVGIMSGQEIEFEILSDGAGKRKAVIKDGKIEYEGALYDELYFEAPNPSTAFAQESFMLAGVTIGKQFHWQRKENQVFAGALKIIVDGGNLLAINIIGVEDYLLSVISSEMSANCSLELLKAHAVISRSWVMARMEQGREDVTSEQPVVDKEADVVEYVKWYDHQEHKLFDVCADDHCQRYQGLTRATGENVRKAVDATWGQILTYDGRLCDARFSKCCGGVMEKFSTCWEDKDYPYLQPLPDTAGHKQGGRIFCDTADPTVISQILNGYDRQTQDFMSWEVKWSREEISRMVTGKSGVDLGLIQQFIPLERGESGRISKLMIKGEKRTLVVGKELEIRRLLSDSHLKSSAFDLEYILDDKPSDASSWDHVILKGRGWGHGVGMCQIGAAVMASEGYAYTQILSHYYPSSQLTIINE
ncbi:MAG: DUF4922 domain-containing protein [Candidatus Cryptobacteroides sp.]